MQDKIVFRKAPFMTMLASAIETYPKECRGELFGRTSKQGFTVEYAFPNQTARRTTQSVSIDWKAVERIHETLFFLFHFRHIGYYHSHPLSTSTLSSADKKAVIETNPYDDDFDSVSIVIAIYKRTSDWIFSIATHMCHETTFKKLYMDCPFAFNKNFPFDIKRKSIITNKKDITIRFWGLDLNDSKQEK
jgi:proteasome lid subunit RPN8/RPN11